MTSADMTRAQQSFRQGNYDEAIDILNALPGLLDNLPAIGLLADSMVRIGKVGEAIDVFESHLDRDEHWHRVFLSRAAILSFALDDRKRAERLAFRILQHEPDSADAAFILLHVLEGARARYFSETFAYNLIGSDVPAHLELAHRLLGESRANSRLLPLFRKLAALKPDNAHIRNVLLQLASEYADFDVQEAIAADAAAGRGPETTSFAMDYLLTHGDESVPMHNVHLALPILADDATRARRRKLPVSVGRRLRIGYISGDFRPEHVVMRQLADILRLHDRSRVDVTLFSNAGPVAPAHAAYFAPMGRHVDISHLSDEKAADEIRGHGIDIAVELGGHTNHSRAALFNLGVAPLQVSWLGYPDTALGIDSDYIIGDRIVTPKSSAAYFGEKFCWMPDSYMPNDPNGRPAVQPVSRSVHGLPEDRFVFASFNTPKKITPEVIAAWAEILARAPESVLWISCRVAIAEQNIARRLETLGIDGSRIIFAPVARSHDEHLLRLRAADLALDTFPYNGHATTADCLWMGLPVLTVKGGNFAGRVSESQLLAIGLGDLVADDRDDYVDRAVRLATGRARTSACRTILDDNRLRLPLFDSERYCRHLENAYQMMAVRAQLGLQPDHFAVPALPPRASEFEPYAVQLAG